ncbi:hypothetical protein ACFY20_05110 [Streptomyces sp. NPDC001312]|uniref:hypothetical protein n=1 Tax=Streptomyces sp. NPDC001312 TaxID=3364561 RepID=UPI00368D918A
MGRAQRSRGDASGTQIPGDRAGTVPDRRDEFVAEPAVSALPLHGTGDAGCVGTAAG